MGSTGLSRLVRAGLRALLGVTGGAAATLAVVAVLPLLWGWHPVIVTSGSMMPRIHPGDVVVESGDTAHVLPLGTVVTYRQAGSGRLITHRIIGRDPGSRYTIKGDANGQADAQPVPADRVVGRARMLIPVIGWPALEMRRHPGRSVIVLALVLLLGATPRRARSPVRPPPRPQLRHYPVRSGALVAVLACVVTGPSVGKQVRQSAAVFTGTKGNASDSLSTRGNFAFASAVIASGPVSYWPLDETSGSTAHDVMGNNPITYNAGTTLGAAGAIAHDSDTAITHGLNQDATANNPASLSISGNLSVMAWEKSSATQPATNARVMAKYDGTNINYLMAWSGTTTTMRFLVDDYPGNGSSASNRLTASSTVSTTDGLWHMLVGTWDGSQCKLYVDGVLKSTANGTGSASVMTNTNPVTLGLTNASMVGNIDEVAVWSKALTATDVSNLYSLGTS